MRLRAITMKKSLFLLIIIALALANSSHAKQLVWDDWDKN